MRHVATLALLALGLLSVGIACGDGDDAPVATDTTATAAGVAGAATASPALEPTQPPEATTTLSGPTSTPRPDVEGPCPVNDEEFCDLARALDAALKSGNIETIVAGTRRGSQSCSGLEQIGPCSGMAARTGVVTTSISSDALHEIKEASRRVFLFWSRT